MNWITRLIERPQSILGGSKSETPEGLWVKCPGCAETLYNKELERSMMVCSKCDTHLRIDADQRAGYLFGEGSFESFDQHISSVDFLNFRDKKKYKDRLKDSNRRVGHGDALKNYLGDLDGLTVSASIFEFAYMGGSMGSVVGEKIALAMERALERHCPYLLVTSSGGARMQEGILSLMQMAKTSSVSTQLKEAKLPFICLLTDPTMGGVSASVAWLGDVIIAEPGALIGFAGPRVIEETVRETLPDGFQRSEFLLEKGLIDAIVDRRQQPDYIHSICTHLMQRAYRQTG
ncbi:MAG: acetyl-CoA carboxylase, carboxyltransferase subunit beta [Mariprofundaceae bacterium]